MQLVRALAPLIIQAAEHSQVWVATHDRELRDALVTGARTIELSIVGGETRIHRLPD